MSPTDDDAEYDTEIDERVHFLPTRWVFPLTGGGYALVLPQPFIELLAARIGDLRTLLMSDAEDPSLRPLFPTAYDQHPDLDAEYQRLMRSELLSSRLAAFDTVEQTAHREELSESELYQWMQSINAVRLAIAERNGFNLEDGGEPSQGDPAYDEFQVLELLGVLLSDIVRGLRAGGCVNDAGTRD